jgi:predicted P-loop ATPase
MFSYLNFISLLECLSRLTKKNQQVYSKKNAPFFPKSDAIWDKFCTQIRVATQTEKNHQ